MKLFNPSIRKGKYASLKFLSAGFACLAMAFTFFVCDPIQRVVDDKLSMRNGSLLFRLWETPPLEVYISVYLFNVTNFERFVSGLDKEIQLDEIGPYVYQEFLENHNASFNDNHTLTFRPHRRVAFVAEKSVGDPTTDVIFAPNIPYMGVTAAASKVSWFAAIAVRTLMKNINYSIMMNITVHDYLWGYEDHLISLASKLIPSVIHFDKFGILDRMFDEGANQVTINIPRPKAPSPPAEDTPSHQLARDFSIENWNGDEGLRNWGYRHHGSANTECNTLRGTFDGTLFPKNITKGETFRVYRKAFCRTLPIVYSHPGRIDGVDAYFFKLADNAFDSQIDDPTSSCFCTNGQCLKKGLGNVTPCYYNIPAAISFPHFFNADPSLLKNIRGLHPNEAQHGSEIVIQPQLGVPMKVHSRFQINLLLDEIKFNSQLKPFQNMVLPILWLEIGVESLTPELILLLQLLFNVLPYVQLFVEIAFIVAGGACIAFALLIWSCTAESRHSEAKLEFGGFPSLCSLPLNTKCLYSEEEQAHLTVVD